MHQAAIRYLLTDCVRRIHILRDDRFIPGASIVLLPSRCPGLAIPVLELVGVLNHITQARGAG
jgi:hypothetical protein